MYSKNDYRYYLENQLMHSDDFLAHYGVLGMKWGQRKQEYIAKRTRNEAKISEYQKKLNTVGAQKRAAKASKYKAKLSKVERKAAKARAKLAKGKNLSSKEMKRIAKAEKYKVKLAKNSAKNDKYTAKIAKLQAKNAKIDKKIKKGDFKEKINLQKDGYKHVQKAAKKDRAELIRAYNYGQISNKQLTDLLIYNADVRAANRALYKKEIKEIKQRYNNAKN